MLYSIQPTLRVVFINPLLGNVKFTQLTCLVSVRNYHKYWPEPSSTANIFMPQKIEDRLLPQLPHTPLNFPNGVIPPIKHIKAAIDMRGPERIHNQLIYRQYGIVALGGGALRGAHLDWIRDRINRYIDTERLFAIWRIDPPWKAVSKKSLNKKMGGGKAKVHHYETPVKAGRILIEVAGIGEYGEVERVLKSICKKLPIYAMPISQEIIEQIRKEKMDLDIKNYNPFEYRDLLRKNFSNSRQQTSPRELVWGGTIYF